MKVLTARWSPVHHGLVTPLQLGRARHHPRPVSLHQPQDVGQGCLVLSGVSPERESLPRVPAQVEDDGTEVTVMPHISGGDVLHPGPGTVVDPFLQLLHWSRPGPEMSLTS